MQVVVNLTGFGVEVNRQFEIQPEELHIYSPKFQKFVEIPIPTSHVGVRPIQCRLLSLRRRIDMVNIFNLRQDVNGHFNCELKSNLIFIVHSSNVVSHSQIGEDVDCTKLSFAEPSDSLIIHVHGGGWIAQSSKSRELMQSFSQSS